MRGKTNILPMVGGYVNAPIGNFVAGENLQLGDLVEKAYSDLPQQIYTPTECVPMTYAHRLYDGKFVVFSKMRFVSTGTYHYESYVYLIERSATQFNVSQFTLISNSSSTPLAATYVPMSDRVIIALIREGNGNSTPFTYSCKKITYNGVDFSIEDINCDNYPTAFNEYDTKWCIGNAGTMIQINSKVYYVTIENNSVVVFGDETASGSLLYLPTQDVFICIGGGVYRSIKVDVVNRTLTVSNDYSIDFQSANVFGDGLIGYTGTASSSSSAKVKLYYATVSNEGLITVQDVWDSDISCYVASGYLAYQLVMFSDFFVFCRINYGTTKYGSSSYNMWINIAFYVFYYRNGFMSGDSQGFPTINFTSGSQRYLNQANMCSIFDEKGFDIMLDYSERSTVFNASSIFVFQQMSDDEFANDDDGFTMVKALHHIDGVVKSGGNAGDTVQVFVPQISS